MTAARRALSLLPGHLGLLGLAFVACSPPPLPPITTTPRTTADEPTTTPPPSPRSIDDAIDDIARICANAMTADGDCVAPTALLCEAMDRTAHACFDNSAEPTRCSELMESVADRIKHRGLGEKTARVVSSFCEATCEVRQGGHAWELAKKALDGVCSDSRR